MNVENVCTFRILMVEQDFGTCTRIAYGQFFTTHMTLPESDLDETCFGHLLKLAFSWFTVCFYI